ncbi:hypothetical protein [Enterococcus massiliensis]|uniref:hypothetical protein n=1 Tax=Enterococcus massiliensis TaxID=1640685 RepID=UPI00065E00EF|nr:hypothetical protein [Enterococcus massiliensis]
MKCAICSRKPEEIQEYNEVAVANEYGSAVEAVRYEEGTYSPTHDLFCCTSCYIKIGMPLRNDLIQFYQKVGG